MSVVKANTYQDASGGSNAVFSGVANPPNSMGFRNRIINGDMRIDQRNAGASVTPVNVQYLVDRFNVNLSQSGKFTAQQNAGSVTPPAGFTNYLGFTSTSAYSVLSTDNFRTSQASEGVNIADLGWGAAGAQAITLSFWVRSSLTGNFGGALTNSAGDRSYPFPFTINSANTWEQKTVAIPGDTTGTWLTTTGVGIRVRFSLGAGSAQTATANTWVAADVQAPTGSVNLVGTNGATFYITGVQLEAGSVASPFERRDYGRELMMCQRYLPAFNSTGTNTYIASCVATSTTNARVFVPFLVQARTSPTGITVSSAGHLGFTGTLNATASAVAIVGVTQPLNCGAFDMTTTGLTAGQAGAAYFNNASGQLLFTGCEL